MRLLPKAALLILLFPLIASALAKAGNNGSELIQQGVVVERVNEGGQARHAGLQVGDILLSWSKGGATTRITSPFDLPHIETEQTPGEVVRLEGLRGDSQRTWLLRSYGWYLSTRPNLRGDLLLIYEEGHALAKAGKVTAAVEKWHAAIVLAENSGASWLPPWFLLRSAQWLGWAGQKPDALTLYHAAVERAAVSGPVVKADLLWELASTLASDGDTVEARYQYEEVLREWMKLGSETVSVAAALVDLGRIALNQGELTKAEECFQGILEMQSRIPRGSIQITISFLNLGVIFEGRGNLAKAEAYYRRAFLAEQQRIIPYSSVLATALADLAAISYQRGDLVAAEIYYRRAVHAAERSVPGSLDEAGILEQLAECIAEQGRPLEAESFQRRSLAIRKKDSPKSLAVASSLAGFGRTARIRGDLESAKDYYQQALTIARELPPSLDFANFLIGAGDLSGAREELPEAEKCYREALALLEKLAPRNANHTETLVALAGVLQREGSFDESARLYEQALTEFEQKTLHLGGAEEDRFRYEAAHERAYKEYVSLLVRKGNPDRALEVLDASRAHSLLEVLSRGHVDVRQGVDHSLLLRAQRLQQLINAKSAYQMRLLQEQHAGEQTAAVAAEVERLLSEYHEIKGQISSSSPAYAALTQPRPLSIREIQALLDDNTLLLEYCLADGHSYVWVVSTSSLAVYELLERTEIEKVVRAMYRQLNARNVPFPQQTELQRETRWKKSDSEYKSAAAKLSRIILGPVASLLGKKRLLIVGDGALQYVSFAALPAPADAQRATATGMTANQLHSMRAVPLVVDHEIVSVASAAVLAELRQRESNRDKAPRAIAVLADPVFDGNDERVVRLINNSAEMKNTTAMPPSSHARYLSAQLLTRSLRETELDKKDPMFLVRLPASREEAEAILATSPASKSLRALDFDASRATAMNPGLREYRIVHIATHGLLNSKHPELSGLVLSMVDKKGRSQNGFLQLQDIYNLQLSAELVVLSGCETGLGKVISGEGLIGLTRGFMYAGAQRVVASLWSVSDEATAELMARFYRNMEIDGLAPTAALRKAQIAMMRQSLWNKPYYWAAFQIQGDWN